MRFDRAFVLPFPAAFVLEMAADRNLMRFHQTIRAVWRNKGELKNCLDILSSLFLLSFKLTGKLIENSRVKTVFPTNYSDILIRKVRIDRNLSFVLKSEYHFHSRKNVSIKENWRYKTNKKLKISGGNKHWIFNQTNVLQRGAESFKKFNFSSKLSFNLISDNWIHPRTDSFSFVFPSNFRSTIS